MATLDVEEEVKLVGGYSAMAVQATPDPLHQPTRLGPVPLDPNLLVVDHTAYKTAPQPPQLTDVDYTIFIYVAVKARHTRPILVLHLLHVPVPPLNSAHRVAFLQSVEIQHQDIDPPHPFDEVDHNSLSSFAQGNLQEDASEEVTQASSIVSLSSDDDSVPELMARRPVVISNDESDSDSDVSSLPSLEDAHQAPTRVEAPSPSELPKPDFLYICI